MLLSACGGGSDGGSGFFLPPAASAPPPAPAPATPPPETPAAPVAPVERTAESVRLIGEQLIPNDLKVDGFIVGGLSGLDYDPSPRRISVRPCESAKHRGPNYRSDAM
jgi:hypothetical protein